MSMFFWSALVALAAYPFRCVALDEEPCLAQACMNAEDANINLLQVGHAIQAKFESKSVRKASTHCIKQYADGLDGIEDGLGNSIRAHPGIVATTSSRRMIFGVGSGSTGTNTVATSLQRIASVYNLDWKTQHSMAGPPENCNWTVTLHESISPLQSQEECEKAVRSFDFSGLHESVGALLDTPVFELFIDFFLTFPNAVYILTTRPSHDWSLARKNGDILHKLSPLPMEEPCGRGTVVQSSIESLSRMFDLTNDFIRCMVPSERLFEMNLFSHQTYTFGELSSFLGLPSYDKSFDDEVLADSGVGSFDGEAICGSLYGGH